MLGNLKNKITIKKNLTPTFSEKHLLPTRNSLKSSASTFHSFGHSGYSDGHSGYSNGHSGYFGGYDTVHTSRCCEPVVDNYSFLALMVFIALATYFLQVAITMNLTGRKKRSAKSGMKNYLLDIVINSGMKLLLIYFTILT